MDRTTRLVDLLRGRESTTVDALASALGASGRTIRRDLAALPDLGVEVEVRRGRGGGVRLVRDTSLPVMRFTDDEALALALALGAAAGDPRLAEAVRSARTRLGRALADRYGDEVTALSDVVAEERRDLLGTDPVDGSVLLALCVATARRHRVRIRHRSRDGRLQARPLDPYGVVPMAGHWYVAGFCGLRREVRTFRVDRIAAVQEDDVAVVVPDDADVREIVAAGIRESGSSTVLVDLLVDLAEEQAREIAPAFRMELERRDDGLHCLVRADPGHLPRLALMVVSIDADVRVVSPPALRDELRRLADVATRRARR